MDDTIPTDESITSDQNMTAIFNATAPLFKQMTEMNAAVLKITPVVRGRKFFSIILVQGEEEVAEVLEALDEVEKQW